MLVKRSIKVWMRQSLLAFYAGDGLLQDHWHTFEGWFLFGLIPLYLREVEVEP